MGVFGEVVGIHSIDGFFDDAAVHEAVIDKQKELKFGLVKADVGRVARH